MTSVYASPGVIKPVQDLPHPTVEIWGELARGFCAALMLHEGTDTAARDRVSLRVGEIIAKAFQQSAPGDWQDGADEWSNLASWYLSVATETVSTFLSTQFVNTGTVLAADQVAYDALEIATMIVSPIGNDEI